MAEQKSYKERVKDIVIQNANSYKRYFVDYEYLLCSEAFVNNEYYIVSAYEDNYLHLTGLHTSLDAATFFEKCYKGTLEENDFAHMCYTLASNLNDSQNGVDNTWNPLTDYGWFDEKSRKDVVGWLGDATIPTDNGSVSFGNDDYIADLDADNIAHRVDYGSGVTAMEAFNNYYDDMNNSNDADAFRGNEFLQNNSYEDVEDVILNNLGCFTYEDLKNNSNYADALRFLERLKAWQQATQEF